MIALDASILIAHLNPRDSHHTAATDFLLSAISEPFLVHSITMAEILVGGARFGREAEMHADLVAVGVQLPSPDEQEPLRLARLRAGTKLKLP
ncbi:PIN domain-containing protein [Aeromicrobium sp. UC242_57]|uniref:PIN domain-containing protein n=1 Tax=Aeromicrobium sp. UC242_57 TaxID=3374624 RepID=UPI0037B4C319